VRAASTLSSTPHAIVDVIAKTSNQRKIDAPIAVSPSVLLLRDGELVLYRRTCSLLYQCASSWPMASGTGFLLAEPV
jgi:predicted P-loop ATPase/GTPase